MILPTPTNITYHVICVFWENMHIGTAKFQLTIKLHHVTATLSNVTCDPKSQNLHIHDVFTCRSNRCILHRPTHIRSKSVRLLRLSLTLSHIHNQSIYLVLPKMTSSWKSTPPSHGEQQLPLRATIPTLDAEKWRGYDVILIQIMPQRTIRTYTDVYASSIYTH